jgi:hypothetical protein
MAKINTNAFNQLSKSAGLSHEPITGETATRKNTSIYDIPTAWIDIIKKEPISLSSYVKVALQEKLKRDGLI